MTEYSIVIPTFGRIEFLKDCLQSVADQNLKPKEVFIIDNNRSTQDQKLVKNVVDVFSVGEISFSYQLGPVNSGAVARNFGASLVSSDIVAFLDDDVILELDYYEKLMNIFNNDDLVVGVQGLDIALVENYQNNVRHNTWGRFLLTIENFFEHSSIIREKDATLRPSLAVCHPIPDTDFCLESQWISTCAGAFKRDLFEKIEFPKEFIKYSWNEYVFFSYSIYKNNLGKMIYTSDAKYRNIPTDEGRLPLKELLYMAEAYDIYIFYKLFDRNLFDWIIFIKSKIGRFLFYCARSIKQRKFNGKLLCELSGAFYFCFQNRKNFKEGNFEAYNEKFPTV